MKGCDTSEIAIIILSKYQPPMEESPPDPLMNLDLQSCWVLTRRNGRKGSIRLRSESELCLGIRSEVIRQANASLLRKTNIVDGSTDVNSLRLYPMVANGHLKSPVCCLRDQKRLSLLTMLIVFVVRVNMDHTALEEHYDSANLDCRVLHLCESCQCQDS